MIGLTDDSGKKREDVIIRSWQEELTLLLPAIAAKHDLIVLLTTLSQSVLAGISETFPDIKIVVGADRRKGNINGLVTRNALFVQTADQGKYLGQLTVAWNGADWGEDYMKNLHRPEKHEGRRHQTTCAVKQDQGQNEFRLPAEEDLS